MPRIVLNIIHHPSRYQSAYKKLLDKGYIYFEYNGSFKNKGLAALTGIQAFIETSINSMHAGQINELILLVDHNLAFSGQADSIIPLLDNWMNTFVDRHGQHFNTRTKNMLSQSSNQSSSVAASSASQVSIQVAMYFDGSPITSHGTVSPGTCSPASTSPASAPTSLSSATALDTPVAEESVSGIFPYSNTAIMARYGSSPHATVMSFLATTRTPTPTPTATPRGNYARRLSAASTPNLAEQETSTSRAPLNSGSSNQATHANMPPMHTPGVGAGAGASVTPAPSFTATPPNSSAVAPMSSPPAVLMQYPMSKDDPAPDAQSAASSSSTTTRSNEHTFNNPLSPHFHSSFNRFTIHENTFSPTAKRIPSAIAASERDDQLPDEPRTPPPSEARNPNSPKKQPSPPRVKLTVAIDNPEQSIPEQSIQVISTP